MIKHYITIALRFMQRNAGLSVIKILGFTIGLAAGWLIYLWVDDELHFDAFHRNSNHIYRVVQMEKTGSNVSQRVLNSSRIAENMQKMFPQIADYAYISHNNDYTYFLHNGNNFSVWPAEVGTNFFSFFDYPFVEGNPETAFIDPQSIVISEQLARMLFGNEPALGRELVENGMYGQGPAYYRINGVVKLPHNTHISFDVAFNIERQKHSGGVVYLRFDDKVAFNEQLQETLSSYLVEHTGSKNLLWFQPLKDIHLSTDFTSFHDKNLGNRQYVLVFSFLAVIIVLMGAFNFMTLSTAQATKRIKEVAVRKTYGGSNYELMWQFFSETIIQVLIAMFLALALAEIFLPFLNNFTHKEMMINYSDVRFWATMLLSLLAVGLVAGSYPALYLSSFSPMLIFKGGNSARGKTGFIRGLVIVQFILSIGLIICTLCVFRQLSYITNKDLGIDRKNIITARCGLWYDVDEFKQEVMRNPNVLSVSMSLLTPEWLSTGKINATWEGKPTEDTVRMTMALVDGDFAKTYGLQVIHGESMKTSREDYWSGKGGGAMINESAARLMGTENPVGKTINGRTIVAVVRDFHFRPLKEPIVPLILAYDMQAVVNISFKLAPGNQQPTIAFIKEIYERMRPGTAFEYSFFDDQIAARYRTESDLGLLFLIFTFLSLSISCLGILGLTAFNVERKTKEIGLRKIAGASVFNIMYLLNKNYIRWIGVAFVFAVPPSAWLMNRWLQGFAYHAPLSWWIFLLAGLIAMILSLVTIIWLCYKAATRNPVESLRYE